jgi:DNA polymerase-3 subunit delta'
MAQIISSVRGHEENWAAVLRQIQIGRLPHAMAFSGPSGTGKKAFAWAVAQALVCENPEVAPCGDCGPCRRVEAHQSEGVLLLESEKGAIKLESAHQAVEFLNLRVLGRARVVIIDGAQTLNPQSANALLKSIEEPPPKTFFILIVPEISQLIPTLRSRVQVLRFAPLSDQILKLLSEPGPEWLMRSAQGSVERLEQLRDPAAQEIRGLVLKFLSDSAAGRRDGLEEILNLTRDRESALKATHFLQQLLRDWTVLESGDSIHSDLTAQLGEIPAYPIEHRVALWRRAFQMELDLVANVDRGLIFENFYQQARHS